MLLLALMSFSVHLVPVSFSRYAFNNDSLVEGRAAGEILESGEMVLPWENDLTTTHSESTPAWNIVLAFFGGVVGIDPIYATQWAVAAIAPLAALTVYVLLMDMFRDRKAALMGSFFVTLFGTFLYLTASGWKESLGVALYFVMIYAYTRRDFISMKFVLILVLLTLPFVHHLIALVSYMTVLFLTGWSLIFAATHGTARRRHIEDVIIIGLFSVFAVGYYSFVSFDKLAYIGSIEGFILLFLAMAVFFVTATGVLMMRSHSKWTFAPIPAAFVTVLAVMDYNGYAFDYTPATSAFNYYLIAVASGLLLAMGWYGLEFVIESRSRLRAIPVAMLIPPVTLMFFALISPTVEDKHQLIYRTFDLADPAIALGVGIAVYAVYQKKRLRKIAPAIVAAAVAVLMTTVPYGLYTEELTGVRHDTQAYEVDAFDWLISAHTNGTPFLSSDERLSFVAWTVYDLGKNNRYPIYLVTNHSLTPGDYYMYEEFWSERGVIFLPMGLLQPSQEFVDDAMRVENVFYMGGPEENQLIIIQQSWIGHFQTGWYEP